MEWVKPELHSLDGSEGLSMQGCVNGSGDLGPCEMGNGANALCSSGSGPMGACATGDTQGG